MMEKYKDLLSIKDARDKIAAAKAAQEIFQEMNQEEVDEIVKAMSQAAMAHASELALAAKEETGYGQYRHKIIKNTFAAKTVYEHIRDMKTVGIVGRDPARKTMDVAVSVGVIAALIPSTNPTSTVIYKSLISVKAGNAVIFSPHPGARKCIIQAAEIMRDAAVRAGAPEGLIGWLEVLSPEGTSELMQHRDVNLILATGGEAMVNAAYRSGTPAIGVGPGNGPAFIEKSADIQKAVHYIIASKTFDNGVICASEQSVVVEQENKERVMEEFRKQGGYFLSSSETEQLGRLLLTPNMTINRHIVGKSAAELARMADFSVPSNTKILLSEQTTVGHDNPYSREKLAPVLAFYTETDKDAACRRCLELLKNEGKGHTLVIHSNNEAVIEEFALKKCVSRILVNTPGSLGGIGASTNIPPALTLGCGAVGGSSTSENVGPQHLLNIRKVAYGVVEPEELTEEKHTADSYREDNRISNEELESIVREVLQQLR